MQAHSSLSGSGAHEEKARRGDEDNVELTVTDAYSFKIFRSDDEEKRKPASIMDLDFNCTPKKPPSSKSLLHMVGYSSNDSSGLFMRSIDSWSIRELEGCQLRLFVRDSKGSRDAKKNSWIKLWIPFKGYEISVHDARIIVDFLEHAMISKATVAGDFLDELVYKYRSCMVENKKILREYYDSVILKFVRLERAPPSLQKAPIIKAVESLLKGGSQAEQTVPAVKRVSSSVKLKRRSMNIAPSFKRRHVEDSVLHKSVSRDEPVDNSLNRDDSSMGSGSRKQDEGNGIEADLPLSPVSTRDDGPSRCAEEETENGGNQQFQDIAEIYGGGRSDGLGEVGDDDEEEVGDEFCSICDDGGNLLLCDGPCMRSFHGTKTTAAQSVSKCRSLDYTVEEVQEMGSWLCPNCEHGQHQCFVCGNLGRSGGNDKEVFVCDVALCGRFYHPHCLANWKEGERFNGMVDRDAFIQSVKEGVTGFCCPAHNCRRCGEAEDDGGDDNSRKFAKCRRCPKALHKDCLPSTISFESRGDRPIRAWEIGNRLLMYCLKHNIEEHLSTPKRDHIKWPEGSSFRRKPTFKEDFSMDKFFDEMPSLNIPSRQTMDEVLKRPAPVVAVRPLKPSVKHVTFATSEVQKDPPVLKRPPPLVTPLIPAMRPVELPQRKEVNQKSGDIYLVVTKISREGQADRLRQFMQGASQNVTLETVKRCLAQPSCYEENKKNAIPRGELASLLNAAKKALEKLHTSKNVELAKRLCPKESFERMLRAEVSLRIYLAPFLHGGRYTSFGRHFTCVDKLKEIVNRIHPYIDDGDMVVDFCCGSNDFSILLSEKLRSTGKTCHFRNFDIITPKNGFCFTKGDWLENRGHDFFSGKKLIMGLNPPFGFQAALATRFILHALKFQPKLLVLIVLPETMSFSNRYKDFGYHLVWEDNQLLKGEAFYLPGSTDDNNGENKKQWNNVTPPLFLWSRGDMIMHHRSIASRCRHSDDWQGEASGVPQGRPAPRHDLHLGGLPPAVVGRPGLIHNDVHRGSGGWLE